MEDSMYSVPSLSLFTCYLRFGPSHIDVEFYTSSLQFGPRRVDDGPYSCGV
jgi:hypothetical protein